LGNPYKLTVENENECKKSYWMQAFEDTGREYDIPQMCLSLTDPKASLLCSA